MWPPVSDEGAVFGLLAVAGGVDDEPLPRWEGVVVELPTLFEGDGVFEAALPSARETAWVVDGGPLSREEGTVLELPTEIGWCGVCECVLSKVLLAMVGRADTGPLAPHLTARTNTSRAILLVRRGFKVNPRIQARWLQVRRYRANTHHRYGNCTA